ncbi:MAG: lamin tail domain-containing protein [Bacteroidales bacterium]|nr:lamin tail domain-containing protein [Bacteroidales bacterium]
MKKILLFLFLLPFSLFAQVTDDFSDGDFSQNPAWSGTTEQYIVNSNQQLQLNAEGEGTAYLSLPITEYETMEWQFWIREAFAPSGNNYTDVWLSADQADLSQATQGYFLRFGEGGSNDAIELFRKDVDGQQSVCRGTDGTIAASFAVAVKVTCDREGNWMIQACYDNSGVYVIEAQGVDDSYGKGGYFGFWSKFTSSNAKKFYFDDIYVGPRIIDHEPPQLLTCEVLDLTHLQLAFNEALDEVTAMNPSNYAIDNGLGHPASVSFGDNLAFVVLELEREIGNGINYTLTVSGIKDLWNNMMEPTSMAFSIYEASEYDIVINEIMADPNPVVGLPEWEFVELYNATDFGIDLKDWQIQIGSNDNTFGSFVLEPHGYVILCHNDAVSELREYGDCIGFGSFSVGNTSSAMYLYSKAGTLISRVSFSNTWYHDTNKANGGWSVEQIDPLTPCAGASNWTASVDASGGTPGRINSVNGENDVQPKVERVSMFGNQIVQLWFDQQMDATSLMETYHFLVEETGEQPQQAVVNPLDGTYVELQFALGFEQGIVYTLVINGVANCVGNAIEADTRVQFGIPNEIAEGEILINEILFDPISPGVDYVELYNNTDKTFDLSTLMLGVIREGTFPNPADTTLKEITADSRLFLPNTYVLLSTNSEIVGEQYDCPTDNFVQMASFPSYANAGGTAILMGKGGTMVDQMAFSEKMHYPLLKVTKGVALERVSFDQPSMDADNWHSAAESVHFGTPGQPNSMRQTAEPSNDEISISPDVFSPDGDGYDDACFINYRFDEAGYTMNIYIFNVAGQLIRHLVKGELVGQEGSALWNGLDNNGNKAPVGIYVVVTEVFNFNGTVKQFKNAAVVGTR